VFHTVVDLFARGERGRLLDDRLGGGRPDIGQRVLVVLIDVVGDCGRQFGD